ncbi:MAG TPA: hypothetical protein VLA19_07780 [Herpetosiphonaceae bacterium]|nr:hypothetical protein [Herpetosiphonaceae bacterium]
MLRGIIFLLALAGALPLLALVALAVVTPITRWGWLYLLGGCLLVIAGLIAPWFGRRALALGGAGLVIIVVVAGFRLVRAGAGTSVRLLTLPGGNRSPWIGRLIDEQDAALAGAQLLPRLGLFTARERLDLVPTMARSYHTMSSVEGATPSPFLRTYLGRQHPDAFDAVVVEPAPGRDARTAVVFLHGYTGNFTLPCWLVAQAARAIDALTVCPSTGWQGHWWKADGERTLAATLAYLRQRGIHRVYLAGLSNGAIGAVHLVPRTQPPLQGLILISGASAGLPAPDLPVLIVHGREDEQIGVGGARAFARQLGARATYVEVEATHFALAQRADEVREAIARWLQQQEAQAPEAG